MWWDEIKQLIITKDTTNLTRTQISHFRTQLSFILEEPLLQRELIWNIVNTTYQQKSMTYLLRGICRTALHILRIQQTKKDLELLLFNQLETVLEETDPPFYPDTWKRQVIPTQSTPWQPYWMPFQATKKYLHIPVQRPWISDEFVMLTEADKFRNGEHIYVLAESSRWKPRQQYCYFPKTGFIS